MIDDRQSRSRHRCCTERGANTFSEGTAPLALRASDLAGLLRVSVRQIWNMHQNGQLPEPVQLSSRLTRWDAAEIGAWWQACHSAKRIIGRAEWLHRIKLF
ncbi:MAG: helix-turn-helix transcriptional regulator [Planctomycetota bacterium]|jgi:predicted DNA-binding transcriptional regulator AlpA